MAKMETPVFLQAQFPAHTTDGVSRAPGNPCLGSGLGLPLWENAPAPAIPNQMKTRIPQQASAGKGTQEAGLGLCHIYA